MNEDILLKFKVTNNENIDIIIEKNFLTFYYSLTDSSFQSLIPNANVLSVEWVILNSPTTIKKNSQTIIETGYISFNQYSFEPNKSYIIQAKYKNFTVI